MNKKTAMITSLVAASFLGITSVATVSIINELKNSRSNAQNDLVLAASSPDDFKENLGSLPELPQISDLPLSKNFASGSETNGQNATNISISTAAQLVVAATSGKLLASKEAVSQGVPAYAITVERSDKSVITGFVDKASGTIFDWDVVRNSTSTKDYDDDDDDEYDDDEQDHDDRDDYDDDDD